MFRNRVLCFARDAGASIFFHCMISISFAAYVLIAIAGPGHAGVNLKNGNFYITYTDIIVMVGGDEFSLSRTYNSKSAQNLSFGYGWGSALDTRLIIGGDGSVSVQEIGSGKSIVTCQRHRQGNSWTACWTTSSREWRRAVGCLPISKPKKPGASC